MCESHQLRLSERLHRISLGVRESIGIAHRFRLSSGKRGPFYSYAEANPLDNNKCKHAIVWLSARTVSPPHENTAHSRWKCTAAKQPTLDLELKFVRFLLRQKLLRHSMQTNNYAREKNKRMVKNDKLTD